MIFKLPTTALIDLDQVVYSVACIVEGQDEPERNIIHSAKLMARARCKEILRLCPSVKHFKLFISDDENFRKYIKAEKKYKGNRPPKPEACEMIRGYFRRKGAMTQEFWEADDHTASLHWTSFEDKSFDTVQVDQDKDADQVPGWRIIPSLKRKGKVVREAQLLLITPMEARRSFYKQLLTGDRSDNIAGIPGYGPVKADKALTAGAGEYELYCQVCSVYEQVYGKELAPQDIYAMIFSRAQLLYMRKFPNDCWVPPSPVFAQGEE